MDTTAPTLAAAADQFATTFDMYASHDLAAHLTSGEADAMASLLFASTGTVAPALSLIVSWIVQDDEWAEWPGVPLGWAEAFPAEWAEAAAAITYDVPTVDEIRAAAAKWDAEVAAGTRYAPTK